MPMTRDYWFARRHPLGAMRGGMSPVNWKGWAMRAAFVGVLAAGAAFGAWFADHGSEGRGIAAFGLASFGAWLGYTRVVSIKGDHVRTVADHRNENSNA